jgi:hypothetical protein
MALETRVTCIWKRPTHFDPHNRIEALGGPGWFKSEDQVRPESLLTTLESILT